MTGDAERELVRRGYDAISYRYRGDDAEAGTFIRADATSVTFGLASFDAVVCLYSLILMPLDDQPGLLRRIGGWLRPAGWLLAVAGQRAWTGTEEKAWRQDRDVVESGRRDHLPLVAGAGRTADH